MSLVFGLTLSCCLAFSWFTNWSVPIERQFPQPLYQIRKIFNPHAIKPKDTYTIILVGDSMTDYLGSGVEIKKYLKVYYPKKTINIHNFSVGSTNILTLPDRLQNLTNYDGKIFDPIFNTDFDIIVIESFGHNPLSDLPLEEGLKKQKEILDKAREMIKQRQNWALVVLLATIAPHHDRYAEGVVNLETEQRKKWADERKAYIENHIEYAKKHKLPLINVYEKSLDKDGGGHIDFINTNDFIHPSPTGIELISKEIADYIFQKRILPL